MAQTSQLVQFSKLRSELAKVTEIDEVKAIRDKAEALRAYCRQAKDGLPMQNQFAEIVLRAERRAGEMLAASEKAKGGRPGNLSHDVTGFPPTLPQLGIERMQSSRWQKIAGLPARAFERHIAEVKSARTQELTTAGMLRVAAKTISDQERANARKNPPSLESVNGRFGLLYADPPWRYDFSVSRSRKIEKQYDTTDLEYLCGLAVPKIAEPDCVLFLWATSPKLPEALSVMKAWDYDYKTCMVWVKDKIGMGYYARQRHELLLIGVKGKPSVPAPEDRPDSVISAPRGKHSAKPEQVYELIETMYPNTSKIELFARKARKNWAAWGNETL